MTATSTPRAAAVLPALYRLFLRSIVTRARLVGIGALGLLGVVIAVAVAAGSESVTVGATAVTNQEAVEFVNDFGLTFLAPVCSLVFATAVLGDLRDDGSLVYLWLRPTPRWLVATAAYLATLTVVTPLTVVPVIVGGVVIAPEVDVVTGTAAALLLAVAAYSAVFVALGLRASRALIWGLVYVLLWEGFISQVGGAPAKVSIANYTRSVLTHVTGTDLDQASASPAAAYIVPLVVTVVALAYTTRRFQRQDVE